MSRERQGPVLEDVNAAAETILPIKNVDREGVELRVGDRVGFIMRGWFLPREQESFGIITSIDPRGGISIDVIENYRRFTSTGRLAARDKTIFFTHHTYDAQKRVRVYSKKEDQHLLSIFRVDSDEFQWHMREAKEAEARKKQEERAAAKAAAQTQTAAE